MTYLGTLLNVNSNLKYHQNLLQQTEKKKGGEGFAYCSMD